MELENKNAKLYFIGGKARHGKSTVSRMVKQLYEQQGKKVAVLNHVKPLKDYVKNYFGWDGKEETKPRELLNQLGTTIIREKLNKKYFYINRLKEDIEILSYFFDVIIVDDVRLKIEIDKQREIFDNLVAIKVVRPDFDNKLTVEQKKHITETDLEDYDKFDYTIVNDGTVANLMEKTKTIINVEKT